MSLLDVSMTISELAKGGNLEPRANGRMDDCEFTDMVGYIEQCFVCILSEDCTRYQRGHPHLCLALGCDDG